MTPTPNPVRRWGAAGLAGLVALVVGLYSAAVRETPFAPVDDEAGETPGFDSPGEAMDWVLMSYRDDQGRIQRDAVQAARLRADAMQRESRARALAEAASGSTAAAGINRGAWTWVGPGNIGGRVRGLAVLPDQVTLVTGGVAGGIWKSSDAGSSWRHIDDFLENLAVSTIVFRPGDPSRLFAGTGEGFFNSDSIVGAGIFTSGDQGESWVQLPSTTGTDFDFVNRLAFSADGSILMAATRTGLFRSTDLGGSWTQALAQPNSLDVKFIAGSSSQVVAAGRNHNAFYSSDGGQTWSTSSGLSGGGTIRVELGVSVSSPSIVYASVDENSGQIWKSTDAGASYQLISSPGQLSSQGWYDNAIWVDPTDPNVIVTGGVSVRRSTNGGVSVSSVSACHSDQHIIIHDPGYNGTTNRRVYFGSDGGVCRMDDVMGNTVTSLRNGLGITQFYGGSGHDGAGRVMGGTQDNGTLRYDIPAGTAAWSVQFGADGGFAAVDPTNPNILYGETQNFRLHRSLDGGSSQYIYGGTGSTSCTKQPPYQITDACNGTANFISPLLLDPNDPNRLLAGGRSLWRSEDPRTPNTGTTGPSWAAIKAAGSANISAIAVAVGNPNIIWVGHNNGDVYMTLEGTSAAPLWTKVDSVVLPNRVVNSIAIDSDDPRIVYVGFGGFSPDSLWRTTNSGSTWEDRTGAGATGLPDAPVRSVVMHPQISDWIYVGSDVGVFASEDGGATWNLPHDGPANVAVFQLFWMGNSLVAVTHGRGMFLTTLASDTPLIARRPQSQAVLKGHTVTFNVVALGIEPLAFQWFLGDRGDTSRPISGATSRTFTTPPIDANTSYWVRVTNSLGVADSNAATLTVLPWGTLLPGNTNQGASPQTTSASAAGETSAAPETGTPGAAVSPSGASQSGTTALPSAGFGSGVLAGPSSTARTPGVAPATAAAPAGNVGGGGYWSYAETTPVASPASSMPRAAASPSGSTLVGPASTTPAGIADSPVESAPQPSASLPWTYTLLSPAPVGAAPVPSSLPTRADGDRRDASTRRIESRPPAATGDSTATAEAAATVSRDDEPRTTGRTLVASRTWPWFIGGLALAAWLYGRIRRRRDSAG